MKPTGTALDRARALRTMRDAPYRPLVTAKGQILVADDEANLRRVLSAQLQRGGHEVHTVEDGEAALAFLEEHHVDVLITDLRMPGIDGMEVLRRALSVDASLPVILLTAHGTIDTAVKALKLGAFDFISKPFDQHEVRQTIDKALRTRLWAQRHASPSVEVSLAEGGRAEPAREGATRFGIIGTSRPIDELYALVDRVADTPTTVLVTGESGTGKELVARALHEASSRRDEPFIKVNCAAIPKNLIESELFGHEKGAFTGAVTSKPGRFELASGGTLFLDEIGEVPPEMQVRLLRVLQESEFERVGGVKTLRVDVRLVTATNRDLRKETAEGTFREDLFYRLNVVPITLPPLRERIDDIPLLCDHFVAKFNARLHKQVRGLEDEAMAALLAYRWPGNVRELENVIERAVLFADGERIAIEDLPDEIATGGGPAPARGLRLGPASLDDLEEAGLKEQVKAATAQIERELIGAALEQTGRNVTHAARLLKISRKGLQLKMKELGLRDDSDGA